MMAANYPVDIIETGPLIVNYCLPFESLYRIFIGIARECNYKDPLKRIADFWNVKTGLELIDSYAIWHQSTVELHAPPQSFRVIAHTIHEDDTVSDDDDNPDVFKMVSLPLAFFEVRARL
eukprot:7382483-Prymnesium_polylepis.2